METEAKVRTIATVPFEAAAVERIAATLGVAARPAPFALPGGAVYQVTVVDGEGRASALLTLWPSIRRIDAIGGGATIVFTKVATVTFVEGVEVLFRRGGGEYLIVAVNGKLIVRS